MHPSLKVYKNTDDEMIQGGKQLREIHWLCRHQEMLLVGHKVNKHTAKLYFLLKCFPNIYGERHVPPLFLRPWEGVFHSMQFSNILLKKFIFFNNIIHTGSFSLDFIQITTDALVVTILVSNEAKWFKEFKNINLVHYFSF